MGKLSTINFWVKPEVVSDSPVITAKNMKGQIRSGLEGIVRHGDYLCGGIFLRKLVIMLLLMILVCSNVPAGISVAAEEGQLLTPDQAVSETLATDSSLRAAQLAMEVAWDEYNAARRILSIGGSYSQSRIDPGAVDNSTKSLMINSGGTPGDSSAWWSLSAIRNDGSSVMESIPPGDTYSLNLTPFNLSQALSIKSKEVALTGKTLAYETTKITLSTGIRTTYAEVVEKAALLVIAREDLDLAKAHLKQVNVFYNVGKIAKLDLMDAEQQVKAAEAKQAGADLSYQTALLKLSIALGRQDLKGFTFRSETLTGSGADQIDIRQTLDRCLKDSPEVKSFQTQMELAGLNLRMAYFFQLSGLQLGVSVNKPKDPPIGEPQDITTYTLKIQGALDDSPLRNLNTAKKNFKAAQDTLDFTVKNMQTKVLDSLRLWKMAELSLEPMDQTINVAKERLRIANLKYDNGMASTSEVNETRKALIASEEAYWQSWYGMIQAREGFFQAVWGNPVTTGNSRGK